MKPRDGSSTPAPPHSDYATAAIRVAVAQICETAGYTTTESSALSVLTDIAALYLKSIARSAASAANSRGRTASNLVDVIAALEDLGSGPGFDGASRAASYDSLSSSVVRELERFVKYSEEIPFAKPLQKGAFVKRRLKLTKRSKDKDEFNGGKFRHVPKWLQPIPEIEKSGEEELKLGFGACMEEESACESKTTRAQIEELGCELKAKTKMNRVGKEEKSKNLPTKRIRVKFKLTKQKRRRIEDKGNSNGSGVCRGGIGKRVLCESVADDNDNDDNNGKTMKEKSSKMEMVHFYARKIKQAEIKLSESMILS